MKCPQCVKENKKSKVYKGIGNVTLMYIHQYYDEDGIFHRHDPNDYNQSYHCTNDHEWTETFNESCPSCDFNKERK